MTVLESSLVYSFKTYYSGFIFSAIILKKRIILYFNNLIFSNNIFCSLFSNHYKLRHTNHYTPSRPSYVAQDFHSIFIHFCVRLLGLNRSCIFQRCTPLRSL